MKAIELAITSAVQAGRLRRFVKENGPGLQGLERLAARYSEQARGALKQAVTDLTGYPAEQ